MQVWGAIPVIYSEFIRDTDAGKVGRMAGKVTTWLRIFRAASISLIVFTFMPGTTTAMAGTLIRVKFDTVARSITGVDASAATVLIFGSKGSNLWQVATSTAEGNLTIPLLDTASLDSTSVSFSSTLAIVDGSIGEPGSGNADVFLSVSSGWVGRQGDSAFTFSGLNPHEFVDLYLYGIVNRRVVFRFTNIDGDTADHYSAGNGYNPGYFAHIKPAPDGTIQGVWPAGQVDGGLRIHLSGFQLFQPGGPPAGAMLLLR
jgi:hypothetical protein